MFSEQHLIEKQQKLLSGRQMFDVELTTNCNIQCYICPREKLLRKNYSMCESIFEKLCSWLPNDCDVFFAGLGEPLMHSSCASFVQRLHDSGRGTSIMTNGTLLNIKNVEEVFDSGLDKLQISIIQKNDIQRISYFTKFIPHKYKNRVVFNIIKEENMPSATNEIEILKENGWVFCEKKVHNRAGMLYDACQEKIVTTCATFFCDTFINSDGEIHVCSNDINGLYNIGTIDNMNYTELIHYKSQFFGSKKICPLCDNCNDEYRIKHFNENIL